VTTHICEFEPPEGESESARELLERYGLPEDVVDGALALFAGEAAEQLRLEAEATGSSEMYRAASLLRPDGAAHIPARVESRAAVSAALWAVAEHNTVAEWICCEPIDPAHALCVQGGAALRMLKALLVDDPNAWKPAPLLDEIMRILSPQDPAAVLLEAADRIDVNREHFPAAVQNGIVWATSELRRLALRIPEPVVRPRRGDGFDQWLKAQRDLCLGHASTWAAVDGLLDQYRLHADTGTPLGEHVCEGRVTGDCDCLESPVKNQDSSTPSVTCPAVILRKPHVSHGWQPQPGMDFIPCPGLSGWEHPQETTPYLPGAAELEEKLDVSITPLTPAADETVGPVDDYEAVTGHSITCLAVAGGGSDPDCPTCNPQFGVPGCTCRPWTRQTDPPRYLDQPGDTLDMIGGWKMGADCPHHVAGES
jgi:hypothetical protein